MTTPGGSRALDPEEKAVRAGSFGQVATHYERFRPGPPAAALDWYFSERPHTVVDLGAGTGALTRLLVDRADAVIAVEPDDRMRAVLTEQVPAARAVKGRGESMPLPDGTVDAVLASSSWHWVDPVPALQEVARVLVPDGGFVGALWSGPDAEGPFIAQARELLQARPAATGSTLSDTMLGEAGGPTNRLEIPPGLLFEEPEQQVFTWDVALNADDLIGLLGTFSWIITMDDDARSNLLDEARRLLKELLGIEGDVTVDVAFRADAWRARRRT